MWQHFDLCEKNRLLCRRALLVFYCMFMGSIFKQCLSGMILSA